MEQSGQQQAELRALIAAPDTPPDVASRARMVLLLGQGHTSSEVAAICGVSPPTVNRWVARFGEHGAAGLTDQPRGRTQVPEYARRRVLELAATATAIHRPDPLDRQDTGRPPTPDRRHHRVHQLHRHRPARSRHRPESTDYPTSPPRPTIRTTLRRVRARRYRRPARPSPQTPPNRGTPKAALRRLPALRHCFGQRLAHRHRHGRRRGQASDRGPPRHHRGPLVTGRRRSRPQTPGPDFQQRPRHLLAVTT